MGMFACVAYINKDSAFEFVKSKLEIANEIFPVKYSEALEKDSVLDKILLIKQAQKSLVGFYEVYDFAKAINQLCSFPATVLEVPVSKTKANITILNFLLQRISLQEKTDYFQLLPYQFQVARFQVVS